MSQQNKFQEMPATFQSLVDPIIIAISVYDPTGYYVRHAGAMLASVFANTRSPVCVYVLTDETMTLENRKKLITIAERFNKEIKFIEANLPDEWQTIKFGKLYTKGILYRLLLPDVLQEKRVIYLDCDIIVDMDIRELWNTPLHEYSLAAAKDQGISKVNQQLQRRGQSLGINEDIYFNSGVLVMDLDHLRKQYRLADKFSDFVRLNPDSLLLDQDFLNWLFQDSYEKLNPSFNIMLGYAEHKQFLRGQQILHFTPMKPWKVHIGGIGEEYWKYVKLTPWESDAIQYTP